MFWKKKKTIDIELPEKFDDNRDAFRIAPDKTKPILIAVGGNTFHAVNISGNGVCIRSHNFKAGNELSGTISLPSEDQIFTVTLKVVSKQKDICRCQFVKIHQDAVDLLHHYILDVQKKYITISNH